MNDKTVQNIICNDELSDTKSLIFLNDLNLITFGSRVSVIMKGLAISLYVIDIINHPIKYDSYISCVLDKDDCGDLPSFFESISNCTIPIKASNIVRVDTRWLYENITFPLSHSIIATHLLSNQSYVIENIGFDDDIKLIAEDISQFDPFLDNNIYQDQCVSYLKQIVQLRQSAIYQEQDEILLNFNEYTNLLSEVANG